MDNEVKEFKENYSLYKYFLKVISNQQKELGFTNKDMARKLNIHLSSYERIISGKYMMTVIQLFRICGVLGLDLNLFNPETSFRQSEQLEQEIIDLDKCVPHEVLDELFIDET